MHHGARPVTLSHKDFDFLKSHGLAHVGAATLPSFPPELDTDAHIWMPDQNTGGTYAPTGQPTIVVPPEPTGCTNFICADLATDLTGILHNPVDLENLTHANARGGADVRAQLTACLPPSPLHPERLGWIGAFYNIRSSAIIDSFDAICLGTLTALPQKRSVSWVTPWFISWEDAVQRGEKIMDMPSEEEFADAAAGRVGWHNSKFGVYQTINGVRVLRNKSLQGPNIGDNGWIYFPREVVNRVMMLNGTAAFYASPNAPDKVETVDLSIVQLIVSYIRHALGLI